MTKVSLDKRLLPNSTKPIIKAESLLHRIGNNIICSLNYECKSVSQSLKILIQIDEAVNQLQDKGTVCGRK